MEGRRGLSSHSLATTGEQVPIEGFEVPEIKDEPVAFGDWTGVESLGSD